MALGFIAITTNSMAEENEAGGGLVISSYRHFTEKDDVETYGWYAFPIYMSDELKNSEGFGSDYRDPYDYIHYKGGHAVMKVSICGYENPYQPVTEDVIKPEEIDKCLGKYFVSWDAKFEEEIGNYVYIDEDLGLRKGYIVVQLDRLTTNSRNMFEKYFNYVKNETKGNTKLEDILILNVELTPSISDLQHVINYDDGTTLEEIKTRYHATDDYDGDLTNKIQFITNYPAIFDEVKIGEYYIMAKVTDSSGNLTMVSNKITVLDLTAPVFSGTTSYNFTYGKDEISLEVLKNGLTCFDNYEKDIDRTKFILDSEFNEKKLGLQEVIISYTDGSGNKGSIKINVTISDTTKPVIEVDNLVTLSTNNKVTEEELASILKSEGIVPANYKKISIASDYFGNEVKEGEYIATASVVLENNEVENYQFKIKVESPKITNTNDYTYLLIIGGVLLGLAIIGTTFIIYHKRKTS